MLIMLIILGKEKEVDQQRGGWTELHQQYECNIERYKRLGWKQIMLKFIYAVAKSQS